MAVVKGTNCGFVANAPSNDPGGYSDNLVTNSALCLLDTSPATATKITKVGWWCDSNTADANFEVGLYAADGAGGAAGTLLHVSRTNAKGTVVAWKTATVDWTISPNTAYWIAVEWDSAIQIDFAITTGSYDSYTTGGTLDNTWGGGTFSTGILYALYAKWEAVSGPANLKSYNTNLKANIKTINTNPIANVKSLNTNV